MTRKRFDRRSDPRLLEVVAALTAAQGNRCAVCGRPPAKRALQLDHDHRTGQIRGLLCFTCNRFVLGKYAAPERLRRAADYLERGGVAAGHGVDAKLPV